MADRQAICSAPECIQRVLARGLCRPHYDRAWRNGALGEHPRQVAVHHRVNTAEWRSWSKLKARCLNPRNPKYPEYGGRGITVCERWQGRDGFLHFFADLGPKPSAEHSIDRIDNDGPYSPENCRWATPAEQGRNTRRNQFVTHEGDTKTITDWARERGLRYGTIRWRLAAGWPVERALAPGDGREKP